MYAQIYRGYKIELDKQIEEDCVKNIWLVHTPDGKVLQANNVSPYEAPYRAIGMVRVFIDLLIKGVKI